MEGCIEKHALAHLLDIAHPTLRIGMGENCAAVNGDLAPFVSRKQGLSLQDVGLKSMCLLACICWAMLTNCGKNPESKSWLCLTLPCLGAVGLPHPCMYTCHRKPEVSCPYSQLL